MHDNPRVYRSNGDGLDKVRNPMSLLGSFHNLLRARVSGEHAKVACADRDLKFLRVQPDGDA